MTDYFLLDPAYKDFPEKRNLKFRTVYGERYLSLGGNLLLCLFFGFSMLFTLGSMLREYQFMHSGTRKAGVVTQTCSTNPQTYAYTFEDRQTDGTIKTYFGKSGLAKFQTCPKVGDRVLVEYMRGEPENSRAVFASTSTTQRSGGYGYRSAILLAIFFYYLTLIWSFKHAISRYKRLRRTTAEVEGKVLYITIMDRQNRLGIATYSIQVNYEFEVNSKRLQGQQTKQRSDLRGQWLPPPGTPIRVLYADDDAYVML